jgi:hypothetical protein
MSVFGRRVTKMMSNVVMLVVTDGAFIKVERSSVYRKVRLQ